MVTECSHCDKKFLDKNALKRHIKYFHQTESSTCYICNKEFNNFANHIKYFHEKKYECSYCDKEFPIKKQLYNHLKSNHPGEKTKCPDCKKDISVDNFYRHIREIHERVRKLCPHCPGIFPMSNLSRHVRQVHNSESLP